MDFKTVLEKLLTAFKEQNIRYALMGGFALGAMGVPRGTVDIDFLVNRDDMDRVDIIMQVLGYKCRYRSDNVSQYVSPLKIFGEVDFLHAFRSPSLTMLQRAEEKKMFNETLAVKVLRAEDIIGFKVQAIANDKSRRAVDLDDIESLIKHHKTALDWSLLEEYFALFGFNEMFSEFRRKYRGD